ncbi:multiheme c-type cytochrome [Armatimonas rosea]|uniref:Cytochrome c5 n=1 Tax=Armatimonas rosea TaxID=685828 RepID=A0A7W9STH8_ARMRO|nr:multiheme c-type cytochrome [Armatimonas rosea]MBB6052386.1 cytochrome c5 [Armatimonas rosea]
MTFRSLRVFLALLLPMAVLVVAACTPTASDTPSASSGKGWGEGATASSAVATNPYVGNDSCKACHSAEFSMHAPTKHMQTLRPATQAALGELAPPAGPLPGAGELAWDQGQLTLIAPSKDNGEPVPVPLDLVLGSGKTGLTFLAVHDQGSVEIRQSYFPHTKNFIVTPSQETFESTVVGQSHSVAETRRCVGCHTVPGSTELLPERKFFGVGCESCHGPGREHVTAMETGDKSKGLRLPTLSGIGGARLNEVCGKCHQTAKTVAENNLPKDSTQRFQPYGLSLSKCFQKSADKLSCVTCHNPHEDASTDTKQYEAVCVSCHSAPKKACPVNPKEKCVSCHMPTRRLFPKDKSAIPIAMADHFIRVFRESQKTR